MFIDYVLHLKFITFLSTVAGFLTLILFVLWLPLFSRSMFQVGLSRAHSYIVIGMLLTMCFTLIFSTSLLVTILSLEGLAFCSYVLAGNKPTLRAAAAGYLYIVLGSLVTICLFLSTIPFLYICGSLDYGDIEACLVRSRAEDGYSFFLASGIALFFTALLFKLAAAPFQNWQLEVYAASQTSIAALFGSVVKIAIFTALIRLLSLSFYPYADIVCLPILKVFGVGSLFAGSIAGLMQTQVKRLLAYSSVFHTGFILLCLAFLSFDAVFCLLLSFFYLFTYVLTFLGTFTVLGVLERERYVGSPIIYLSDLVLVRRHSVFYVICLISFSFSFLGLPPLAGFFAKFFVFWLVIHSSDFVVISSLIIFTAISAFYYLRLIFLLGFGRTLPSLSYRLQSDPFFYYRGSFFLFYSRLLVFLFISSLFLLVFFSGRGHFFTAFLSDYVLLFPLIILFVFLLLNRLRGRIKRPEMDRFKTFIIWEVYLLRLQLVAILCFLYFFSIFIFVK